MTLWAILSDVHGRTDRLARALADAKEYGATRLLSLGDAGGVAAIERLDAARASYVFGNWEASGLRGLPGHYRNAVAEWPALYRGEGFWAAHASPVWPEGLAAGGVVEYLRVNGLHWNALFPLLQHSPEARRDAFAELDAAGVPLFFHGHTHVQEVWCRGSDGVPTQVRELDFDIEPPGSRWLVGVGSAGASHDGGGACYALYDDARRRVALRRV